MFYLINSSGAVVASASGPVNMDDPAFAGAVVVASDLDLRPSEVEVADFPAAPRIVAVTKRDAAQLKIATTAKDSDGDGLPELRANGKDRTTITVEAPVTDALPVTFRTTAGRLSARVVDLDKGTATVQFTAGRDTVAVTITAAVPGFADARLDLELIP